jgi:predicted alpha/beta hydrolase family esterase
MEVSAQPLPCPALVVGSADDPYCTPEAAVRFAARWEARWHLAGACGHINSASGLGSWRHGRELLDSLTQ